jgi:ATP-binding cassette subfamily F protein uup
MSKNIISVEHLQKAFAEKVVCNDASFGIHEGDKIGLIGINGCGKTTLLRMIAGLEPADEGTITVRNGQRIGYLPQIPQLDLSLTVEQQIYRSNYAPLQLLRRYHELTAQPLQDASSRDEAAALLQKIQATNAWDAEIKAKQYLTKLGFSDFTQQIAHLSGGQKRRIDLARVMMEEPQVLVLDEPTNHLDIDTIEWLQDFLQSYKGVVLFVTHDRYFLDAVSTRILEIEDGDVRFYQGNYSFYVQQKELQMVDLQRKETRRASQLKKELQWLQRGARARTSKPKNHVDRVKELLSKSYLTSDAEMEISFASHRLGKTILNVHNVGKSYRQPLFSSFNHTFQKMERIGIIGPNGCGKTTLLRLITGEEHPDSGSIKQGVNTQFAYFRQDAAQMDESLSVLQYIKNQAEHIRTADGTLHSASEMLQRFLFDGKMQQSKISSLSGGERKRLYLLSSLMFGSNFIILDEPTNDLDIKTLEILEDYLDAFRGCLIVVSHDRYFLDRVVDYLFVFEESGIRKFPGNYSDYLLVRRYQQDAAKDEPQPEKQRVKTTTVKLSFNEKRELQQIETQMEALNAEHDTLTQQIETQAATLSHHDFAAISHRQQAIAEELETLELRWLELEEKREMS